MMMMEGGLFAVTCNLPYVSACGVLILFFHFESICLFFFFFFL